MAGQIKPQERVREHTGGGNADGRKAPFGSIRQRGPKRFQARYTGPDRKTYTAYSAGGSATFQAKQDAVGALARVRVEIDAGTWQPPTLRAVAVAEEARESATLFGVYADAWLQTRPLSPRTVEHYAYLLRKHVRPTWGELELSAITPAAIRRWHARPEAKPTARAHSYSLMRSILATAVADGIIAANPCAIRGAGTAKTTKKIRPLEVAEVNALTEALPEKYRMLAQLGCWCSLRFGELAGLQRADVDLGSGLIHIRRGVVRTKSAGLLVKTPKTTAGLRSVTLPKHLAEPLRVHLSDHSAPGADGWVFPGRGGGPLAASTLQRVWGPAAKKAGRPDATPHTLRHTGQTLAAQEGANLRELMARAGQVSPAAALRYLHDADSRQREIADALSRLATGG